MKAFLDFSFMERIPLSAGGDGSGAGPSTLPLQDLNFPPAQEEERGPNDFSFSEGRLQRELELRMNAEELRFAREELRWLEEETAKVVRAHQRSLLASLWHHMRMAHEMKKIFFLLTRFVRMASSLCWWPANASEASFILLDYYPCSGRFSNP